jgi:hypothetical protein
MCVRMCVGASSRLVAGRCDCRVRPSACCTPGSCSPPPPLIALPAAHHPPRPTPCSPSRQLASTAALQDSISIWVQIADRWRASAGAPAVCLGTQRRSGRPAPLWHHAPRGTGGPSFARSRHCVLNGVRAGAAGAGMAAARPCTVPTACGCDAAAAAAAACTPQQPAAPPGAAGGLLRRGARDGGRWRGRHSAAAVQCDHLK